jgi:hypothetical protein
MANSLLRTAVLTASLIAATTASARVVVDPADPAFAGSTRLPLTAASGFVPGAQTFATTVAGVALSFATDDPRGLLQGPFYTTRGSFSSTIEFSPPVSAVAMVQGLADGCSGALDVHGVAGTETVVIPFGGRDFFAGAADIGEIDRVTVRSSCAGSLIAWNELVFAQGAPPPPPDRADLSAGPEAAGAVFGNLLYGLAATNHGPAVARAAQLLVFPPPGASFLAASVPVTVLAGGQALALALGDLAPGAAAAPELSLAATPSCEGIFLNVSRATSATVDPDLRNNGSWSTTQLRPSPQTPEICDNDVDDNCDGLIDCGDPACGCVPHVLGLVIGGSSPRTSTAGSPAPPFPFVPGGPPPGAPAQQPAGQQHCTATTFGGQQVQVEASCCEPGASCHVSDPNFKEADPPVNAQGFGYTEAGRRMTYTIHYENVGDLDALDVEILDPLDADLDASTLLVEDGGAYDAATRTIRWLDPVLPPHTPRTVRFSIQVRADAPPQTRVRNVATIVFPNGTPPSRLDTAAIEHVIRDPAIAIAPELAVTSCAALADGTRRPTVTNFGFGFAHDVTAELVDPAAAASDATAAFAHPDDPPGGGTTVIPLAATTAVDTVAVSSTLDCAPLTWRIRWRELDGSEHARDVRHQAPPPPPDQPPTCGAARPTIAELWPPNHKLVAVRVAGVSDPEGGAVSVAVTGIRQDEPVNGTGDGDRAPDGFFLGDKTLLRAERRGHGDGRVYHVAFTASDGAGQTCSGEVRVCVPHDRGRPCVDGGPLFVSTEEPRERCHRGGR